MASGLATVNNIGQIGESLGYTIRETAFGTSLPVFGRCYVSDQFLHARGWGALYVGSVLVGICYGPQWSLMPTITSEIFGVGNMGSIFNTITIASPVGSYIFSVRVVGYIYDKEVSEGNKCIGTQCFILSFLIMASATVLGSLEALVLFFRTTNYYGQVVHRRIQNVL
ncbi:hypothetical protein PIB30_079853 [Stylosanthes scabra]|uniref:NFD4 C-terminal domain-containing protein n=1 Tax=Stylosanthes scabra TaxID=79078 RepID=A0ABU6ZQ10_9FABA|nr:hypothetical protein [Stylosanthes scabra]